MPKILDKIGLRKPGYSAFDLSREQKLTFKMGQLVPTYLEEIVPGDQFRVKSETLLRMAPMLAPIMHRLNVYMHYFFVPNRITWQLWEEFITGGQQADSEPAMPVMKFNKIEVGDLADYLGLPLFDQGEGSQVVEVSQIPFRAYNLIVRDYYRDADLVDDFKIEDLPEEADEEHPLATMKVRSWEKDYFTSARPWAQRGGVDISISGGAEGSFQYLDNSVFIDTATGNPRSSVNIRTQSGQNEITGDAGTFAQRGRIENLASVSAAGTVNDLRKASAIQRWLERSARGGHRYIETILSHFGVKSPDGRLQRPEYLGGGRQPVVISEVLNTTGTEAAPQGDYTGHGISAGTTNSFQARFTEHGYVIGIMSVMPKTSYYQGIPRHYSRKDRFDYYWPEFAHLGEQEVKYKELFLTEIDETNELAFGYQQRYAEYKHAISTVHGEMKDTLDFWHIGRKFNVLPNLNKFFVELQPESAEVNRIFAVPDGTQLIAQLYHNVKARRPMPYFSNPRIQ